MPYQLAGTEVYTWALAKSLQRKGHTVTIVIPNYGSIEQDEYKYDGLTVKRYSEPDNRDRLLIMGKRAPDGIYAFEKVIRNINPDIVHIQELAGSSGIGIFHLRLLKKMKIKIIFTMHLAGYSCFCGTLMYRGKEHCDGLIDIKRCTRCALSKLPISDFTQQILYTASLPLYELNLDTGKANNPLGTAFSYPFIIKKLRKGLFEIADLCEQFIILTDWYKEVLLKNGIPESKIKLVKQALPYVVKTPANRSKAVGTSINLVFIGRIDPLKGLHLLLEALQDVPEDKISLDIYGAVNDKLYYNHWQEMTKSKSNIRWKGTLRQEYVVTTLSSYDALVLPSAFSEMSPLVIQEAFAASVPVIGSDVAGIAEQIKPGYNGLLFNFNDTASLKQVLISVLNNPVILHELRKQIHIPDSFERVVEETIIIYNQALSVNQSNLETV